MCKSPIYEFLKRVPKVENHLHIEGTLEPTMLFKFATRNGIELPKGHEFFSPETLSARYGTFTCLDEFLRSLYLGATVLVTAQDFEELAWAYYVRAAKMNVRHIEVSFDPQMHTVRGISYDTIVEGLSAAKRQAEEQLDITIQYIACIHRHLPLSDSNALVDTILARGHLKDGTVHGVGLVSNEKPFPPHMFADLFRRVALTGTKLTAHVGEEVGPEAVRGALEHLKVSRIDHGLTSAQDPKFMEELASSGTLLTLCPWSNVAIGVISKLEESPVRQFLDAKVKFSINSDDPAYNRCWLQDVYYRVQDTFNLSLKEWEWIIRGGVEGSWCEEGRKREIMEEIDVALERFQS